MDTRKMNAYIRNLKSENPLSACWNALAPRQKRYARELVERFGWETKMAIQFATLKCPAKKFTAEINHGWYEVNGRTGKIGAAC